VRLIIDRDNPLTDSDADDQAELHMQAGECLTIFSPEGDELYVNSHPVDGEFFVSGTYDHA
jgi:hypothetical protein